MTDSFSQRLLIIIAPGQEESPVIARLLAKADLSVTTLLVDAWARDQVNRYGAAEILEYSSYCSPWGLVRDLRSRCFDRVFLISEGFDLRLVLAAWGAAAPECSYLSAGGGEDRPIRIWNLIGPLFWRGLVLLGLLPAFLLLRLFFFWEKYICRSGPVPLPEFEPWDDNPPLSVVIPNYNGEDLLRECLPSVVKETSAYGNNSEVIVVDDGSTDSSIEYLKTAFPTVKVLPLSCNQGFGEASDRGIRSAKNELILLLNSDISATAGFIRPLVETIKDPKVFAVQPRADSPQGGLNFGVNMGRIEQGYLRIWNEADTPEEERVNQLSPTLYALGGAMLFDRRKYEYLGGFDPIYKPFRWEDIDLCYRALKRGWEVVYQPSSLVIHKHHATLNRVFSSKVRNVVETRNEMIFAWKNLTEPGLMEDHLSGLPVQTLGHLLAGRFNFIRAFIGVLPHLVAILSRRARERSQCRRRDRQVLNLPLRRYRNYLRRANATGRRQVLVINPVYPYPPVDGGKQRVYHVLKALAQDNDIHLLCFVEPGQVPELEKMREFCLTVNAVEVPAEYGYLGAWQEAFFPMYYRHFYSPELVAKLREILDKYPIDLVQVEFDKMLYYADFLKSLPSVYVEHDVASLYLNGGKNPPHKGIKRLIDVLEWARAVKWEVVKGRKYWKILTLSPEDERVVRRLIPGADIAAVKHGTCVEEYFAPYKKGQQKSLIYVGSFGHYPNVEAVTYFYQEIWPLVRQEVPEATLTIVGSRPTEQIKAFGAEPGIEVTGFVESVNPYLDAAAVFIAPMRKGFGMKGKILEAMARGKPVVTTPIGVRGAAVKDGKHLMIGRDPESFAQAVIRLLTEEDFREKVALAGQKLVVEQYDWGCSARQMNNIFSELLEED